MLKSILSIKRLFYVLAGIALLLISPTTHAASIPVTYNNFGEVETTMQMSNYQKLAKGVNKWYQFRTPTPIDNQPTIRMNRDTLYSMAVVNVTDGAVITLPDAGRRYMSLLVINELGYANHVYYGQGSYKLTAKNVGSDYAIIIVRILTDAHSEKDVKIVNALQDELVIKAKNNTPFKISDWDKNSYTKIYDSLVGLFAIAPSAKSMFGTKENVNPVLFLLGAAGGFAGLPDKDAVYINVAPDQNGKEFNMTLKDVPVDGFWSFTVYNKAGYLFNSEYGLSNISNMTAKPNSDGSYTLYFGNCKENKENCLAIEDGWNFVVRLYEPQEEIISGTWTLPELKPIN